jgi:hypothetical protein
MGSDGLFDNLFDKEILSIVRAQVASSNNSNRPKRFLAIEPQKISDALAERAKYVSNCKLNVDSPFQVRAVNEGLYYQVCNCYIVWFIFLCNNNLFWFVIIGRKSR